MWRYEPGHCIKCDVQWGPGVWDNHRGECQGTVEGGNVFYTAGADYWFGASIYVPADWVPDQYRETWFQFHASEDVGDTAGTAPIHIFGNSGGFFEIGIAYSTGNPSEPGTETRRNFVTPVRVVPGSWHDIVFLFNEDPTGAAGKCYCWIGGLQVLKYKGALSFENTQGGYWKFGVYKGAWSTGDSGTPNGTPVRRRTYWYDEIVTGDASESYATIAPRGATVQPALMRTAQSLMGWGAGPQRISA